MAAGAVTLGLAKLERAGGLAHDPLQHRAAVRLDKLAADLEAAPTKPRLAALFGRPARPPLVKGVYLHGPVGRGKTMLMNLFFAEVGIAGKRRVHFHEFMDEMHEAIGKFRVSPKGRAENSDPIAAAVKPFIGNLSLICLDEFQISDITNAMLVGRLFEKLFAGGITLVATSNTAPDALYADGLNRRLFLPFIALLKAHTTVFSLAGATDYRQEKFAGQQVFCFTPGPETDRAMDALWRRLTGGVPAAPESLEVLGRTIKVPGAAMGAARFPARALIDAPLGARDYLRLAQRYDTIMIDAIPQFDRTRSNAAKRFILLIDTLYDRGVKLAASFAVPLDELARDDRTRAEFARATSRLAEMGSAAYLAAPHKPHAQG